MISNHKQPSEFNIAITLGGGLTLAATLWCSLPTSDTAGPAEVARQHRQSLAGHLTSEMRAAPVVGRVPAETRLTLAVSLPVKDPAALAEHVRRVSDPRDTAFRHFISREEFAEQHGASESNYQAVAQWAAASGFEVTTHKNRLVVEVTGSAAEIEAAFDVHLQYARRPDGSTFRTPDREPSLALAVAIEHVSGLDTYALPLNGTSESRGTGHEPASVDGSITPQNIRAAYRAGVSGTLNGHGQTVCIWGAGKVDPGVVETYARTFDGGFGDATGYVRSHLHVNDANLSPDLDGATIPGLPDGSLATEEAMLDIQMVVSMAPGATLRVIGSPLTNATSDLQTVIDTQCLQITASSCATGWNSADFALVQEIALHGQSFFLFSGDYGAYLLGNTPPCGTHADEPITNVGGTGLRVWDGGTYAGETAWPNSGGGHYLDASPLPAYQAAVAAVNADAGGGASLTVRNSPDVSAVGTGVFNVLTVVNGAGLIQANKVGPGTSYSTPIWGGFMALVNQATDGGPGIGFANPALYALFDGGTNFHSVDGGNNGYPVVHGYNLVTGLGSPTANLITTLGQVGAKTPWTVTNAGGGSPSPSMTAIGPALGISGGNVYKYSAGAWTELAVLPRTSPAIAVGNFNYALTAEGRLYEYIDSWVSQNQSGTGAYNNLISFATLDNDGSDIGVWAISSSGNALYTQSKSTSTWSAVGSVPFTPMQVAVAGTGTPWVVDTAGGIWFGTNPGTSWTWTSVPFPAVDGGILDGGGGQIQARSIAVGGNPAYPDGSYAVWVVSDKPAGSGNYVLLELVNYLGATNVAWNVVRGSGGVQLAVKNGYQPWMVDSSGYAYDAPGYPRQ